MVLCAWGGHRAKKLAKQRSNGPPINSRACVTASFSTGNYSRNREGGFPSVLRMVNTSLKNVPVEWLVRKKVRSRERVNNR